MEKSKLQTRPVALSDSGMVISSRCRKISCQPRWSQIDGRNVWVVGGGGILVHGSLESNVCGECL